MVMPPLQPLSGLHVIHIPRSGHAKALLHYKYNPRPFRSFLTKQNQYQSVSLTVMSKVIVFAALFAALLALASATTYTTVVTTTMVDEGNPRGRGESCMQEYEQQQKMRHCRMWMQKMGGRYLDASVLRNAVTVSNPMRGQGEHLQECCQQLEQISSPCMCEAMKMMWMEQQREQGSRREEMQEMKEMVEKLPQMCGMETRERCRLNAA